jgi:hypothetical protein
MCAVCLSGAWGTLLDLSYPSGMTFEKVEKVTDQCWPHLPERGCRGARAVAAAAVLIARRESPLMSVATLVLVRQLVEYPLSLSPPRLVCIPVRI